MARRASLGMSVFDAALGRLVEVYAAGHRVVVSFSGGKDSCVMLEMALIAARQTNRLPVEIVYQDEEVSYPGTFDYVLRTFQRPEVTGKWLVMQMPQINVFSRAEPYWWAHDWLLPPEKWVTQPPDFAYWTRREEPQSGVDITVMTTPMRFPVKAGQRLYSAVGLRAQESRTRLYGVYKAMGHLVKPNKLGVHGIRPIYDWTDADVWLAIQRFGWDYNRAYDTMYAMMGKKRNLRIAPPSQNVLGIAELKMASAAWPRWFDSVCARLPGARTAAQFGRRAVEPRRNLGETWEAAFQRECIDTAPGWIGERASEMRRKMLHSHAHHATTPFPEVRPCYNCLGSVGSWRRMTLAMYGGDPFSVKAATRLPLVEPEFFRPGAGRWGVGGAT